MAVYIPAGKRRRRLAVAVATGVVVGLVAGLLIGRATAPGLHDGVAQARSHASEVVDALDSLPVEYQGTLAGSAGKTMAVFEASLDRVSSQLDAAIGRATWFGPGATERLHSAVAKVRTDAEAKVSAVQFGHDIDAATAAIDDEFGIRRVGA